MRFSPLAEYVEHLKAEGRVCAIVGRLQRYLQARGSPEELCRVYLRRVLHTYYKFDYAALRKEQGLEVRLGRNGAILGNFGGSLGSLEAIGGHWRPLEVIRGHWEASYGGLWGAMGGFGGPGGVCGGHKEP